VYIYAMAGTEGWVRAHKLDDEGFDLVKIEWDKQHWRYNGQPDGWTYADHFYIVGPPTPPKQEEEEGEVQLPEMPASESELDEYVDVLTQAMDAASESEGFIMLAVKRAPNPEKPDEIMFIPQIYQHAVSKEAALLLDMQIAEVAASSYQELVFNMMQAMKSDEGDDES
jgi:hypothetical protein